MKTIHREMTPIGAITVPLTEEEVDLGLNARKVPAIERGSKTVFSIYPNSAHHVDIAGIIADYVEDNE